MKTSEFDFSLQRNNVAKPDGKNLAGVNAIKKQRPALKKTKIGTSLMIGELKALLTCSHPTTLFKRLVSRTMVLLKTEPAIRHWWNEAKDVHRQATVAREELLKEFERYRNELKLDAALPSLRSSVIVSENREGLRLLPPGHEKIRKKKIIPTEMSDRWVGEARAWAYSQKEMFSTKRGRLVADLLYWTDRWESVKEIWGNVGEHPKYAMARLMRVCERIDVYLEDECVYVRAAEEEGTSYVQHLEEEIQDMLCEIKLCATNLIAELPIYKSWTDASQYAIQWKRRIDGALFKLQGEDLKNGTFTSLPKMARKIHEENMDLGVGEEAILIYLRKANFRMPEEAKQAKRRKRET